MRNVLLVMVAFVVVVSSCKKNNDGPSVIAVPVKLVYPATGSFTATEGVKVTMTTGSSVFVASTDANGITSISVPLGVYDVSASDSRSEGGKSYAYNGAKAGVTVTSAWKTTDTVTITLTESQASQIVIKELYGGGVQKDDNSGVFQYDRYVTLYNNSATTANLNNICIGMIAPYNAQGTNGFYGTDGELIYAKEGWIPATQGFWYFQSNITIAPGKQIIVALNNAVNNTLTYTKSVNLANADYYCMYDITKYSSTSYYVAPAAVIPTSHYMKAEAYGTGTAWALSVTSPGLFLFDVEGTTPSAFAADASKTHTLTSYTSKKVPVEWVIDGVEAYLMNNTGNKKRFTPAVDAGAVYHLNGQGYSIYRNVNKTATEALSENVGKLVYNYSKGTVSVGGTTDPSGIDAEASIKLGARIIYQDTNNSTNDFHLRSQAALRD
ncbi:MAG: DUF4876 domain-containing protein [Chitinophagaceae bacterium]